MALPSLARSRRFASSSRSPVSEARECAGYDKCRRYATRDPPFLATCDLRVHPFVSLAGENKFRIVSSMLDSRQISTRDPGDVGQKGGDFSRGR